VQLYKLLVVVFANPCVTDPVPVYAVTVVVLEVETEFFEHATIKPTTNKNLK
jgi:hypothetical protein